VTDEPIKHFALPRGPSGTLIACINCPSHNTRMDMTGIHPAPGGLFVHLACSNGHRQRLVISSVDGNVVLALYPSDESMSARPGEIVH
jgi:hypothetical protein